LPALGKINELVWVLDQASPGDFVTLERISLTATTPITDTASAAFTWSYGMLLNNWNPETGLVRDKAREASGIFDAIQATGSLAAATAQAEQLGVVSHAEAVRIVDKIGATLLYRLPRQHGLWPHWVKTPASGEISIVENTEWSSVDTAIAALGLLEAQSAMGLDISGTENMLREIDWQDLTLPGGVSHGYAYNGERFPFAWDVFGGETWLTELVYASSTGQVKAITYAMPPTANGSGFIDEMAWLFVSPPVGRDYWETDWAAYRKAAAEAQVSYYQNQFPDSCLAKIGLFGLSAAEVPGPSLVTPGDIYQAFGVGGRFAPANDGSNLFGSPVVIPHYAALAASLQPKKSLQLWDWLIDNGYFSPLNNAESLMFPANSNCEANSVVWNHLKGSWNLSLQTLGWGHYLAERAGQVPVLWQAGQKVPILRAGSALLSPYTDPATGMLFESLYERECENPDESDIGQTMARPNASGGAAHAQFGTTSDEPWPAKAGSVKYSGIQLPLSSDHPVYLKLRYSKFSPSSTPIMIYINDETVPRVTFYPKDQGNWELFAWSDAISLGPINEALQSITFSTDGQLFGVVDMDKLILFQISPATVTVRP